MKPLDQKAYEPIPHLPGSRLGPGDHRCPPAQARVATVQARDRHDVIIVQEKLDGSNVACVKRGGKILALTRAGQLAWSSRYEQHQLFAHWVQENEARFALVLQEGERICGEWLAQAHGTRYALPHEPFVAFDLMAGAERAPMNLFLEQIRPGDFITPQELHRGGPLSIAHAEGLLESSGHGALDPVEGAVWRCERQGVVDFVVKWVRPEKEDGIYLPQMPGKPAVWNWRPHKKHRSQEDTGRRAVA
jgi:hypothetical protein